MWLLLSQGMSGRGAMGQLCQLPPEAQIPILFQAAMCQPQVTAMG